MDSPNEHFVDEHAERPPVYSLVVALAEDDLWRQVLGGAAQRPRPGDTGNSLENSPTWTLQTNNNFFLELKPRSKSFRLSFYLLTLVDLLR